MSDTASPTRDATSVDVDASTHRQLGVELYNSTWALIEKPDRTPAETDEMIHRVHASRWHWARAAGVRTINHARGEYLCSRVYATLGRAEPAAWHARRCLEIVESTGEDDGREPWDLAGACEAMARAAHVAGDAASTRLWKSKALEALARVDNAEDREPIAQDLATLPD